MNPKGPDFQESLINHYNNSNSSDQGAIKNLQSKLNFFEGRVVSSIPANDLVNTSIKNIFRKFLE